MLGDAAGRVGMPCGRKGQSRFGNRGRQAAAKGTTAYGRERQRRSIRQPRDRLTVAPEERQHSAASWRDARRVPPARGAVSRQGWTPVRAETGYGFGSRQPGPQGDAQRRQHYPQKAAAPAGEVDAEMGQPSRSLSEAREIAVTFNCELPAGRAEVLQI
jgi:hypothetical protein